MFFSDVTRKQAFLTHMAVSLSIFGVITYLIVFHWFPDFYFYLDGGNRAIVTIFFVDVVLGPGLTLLVFKPGKKSLKFDMTVILLLQLSALSWGVNSVYEERSGATTFFYGKFTCIPYVDTADMNMETMSAGPSGQQRLGLLQRPDTMKSFFLFTEAAFKEQSAEVYYYADKIRPLNKGLVNRLKKYKLNLQALEEEDEVSAKLVRNYLNEHEDYIAHISLIPISCRYGSAIAVYDERELQITDLLKVTTALRAKAQDEPLPLE